MTQIEDDIYKEIRSTLSENLLQNFIFPIDLIENFYINSIVGTLSEYAVYKLSDKFSMYRAKQNFPDLSFTSSNGTALIEVKSGLINSTSGAKIWRSTSQDSKISFIKQSRFPIYLLYIEWDYEMIPHDEQSEMWIRSYTGNKRLVISRVTLYDMKDFVDEIRENLEMYYITYNYKPIWVMNSDKVYL